MRTVNYLIVELDEAYNNEEVISTGDSVIVNSTIESVENINRVARVVAAPDFTILKEGDEVVVHHNIFRLRNSTKGNQIASNYDIGNNQYIVPLTEVFMYKREGEWKAIKPYCFVEPVETEKRDLTFDITTEESYKGRLDKVGILRYINEDLSSQGVSEGDRVLFSRFSEYEFLIEGKLYYKMSSKDILAVL
jgi:co-chaperonin GroES (HSP10)